MTARLAWVAVAVTAAAVPLVTSNTYYLYLAMTVAILVVITSGLNVLAGLSGQISLGHAGFYAVGAYAGALLATRAGLGFWIALPVAVALTAAVGALLALAALRVSGPYLAMVTIAFGVIVEGALVEWVTLTGGPGGIFNIPRARLGAAPLTLAGYYLVVLLAAAAALWSTRSLMRSTWGRAFVAVKNGEIAAESLGLGTYWLRTVAFTISAGFAGAGGCLFAFLQGYLSPDSFTLQASILFLLIVLFGGLGTLAGPLVGSAVLVLLPEFLREFVDYRLILYGTLLLLSVYFLPRGLVGALNVAGRRTAAARPTSSPTTADASSGAPVSLTPPSPTRADQHTAGDEWARQTPSARSGDDPSTAPAAPRPSVWTRGEDDRTPPSAEKGPAPPKPSENDSNAPSAGKGSVGSTPDDGKRKIAPASHATESVPRPRPDVDRDAAVAGAGPGGAPTCFPSTEHRQDASMETAHGRQRPGGQGSPHPPAPSPPPRSRPPGHDGPDHDQPRQNLQPQERAALLSIEDVSVSFGGLRAVADVSLDVGEGTIHSLIGPNGAGKTTLVNLVTGFYRPDRGRITFRGAPITGLGPAAIARRGLVRTFQTPQLFDELSVADNVMVAVAGHHLGSLALALVAGGRGTAALRVRADRLLHSVGLADWGDAPATALPFGLRRRLEIARALGAGAVALLLDEPAAGLVPAEVVELDALLGRLRVDGLTIVLIEHHIELVMAVSDRVTVLDEGRVIAEGPPESVQRHAAVVEAYLG